MTGPHCMMPTLSAPSLSPQEMSLSADSKARSVTELLFFQPHLLLLEEDEEEEEEWAFLK